MSELGEHTTVLNETGLEDPLMQVGSLPARFADATRGLTSIIRQENKLLEDRKVSDISPLQAEKTRLAAEYQRGLAALRANPDCLGPEGSPIRRKLRQVTAAFQDEMRNHTRLLLRMKSVAEGIISSITDEANRQTGTVTQYNQGANVQHKVTGGSAPIALNEII